MIFPRQCKEIGIASTRPCGDLVYFLSRYLIHDTPAGPEILEVTLDPSGKGLMREVVETRLLAGPDETWLYPEKVQLHDRARLVRIASDSGKRCTIFTGIDDDRCNEGNHFLNVFHHHGIMGNTTGKDNGIHFTVQYGTHRRNRLSNLVRHGILQDPGFFVPFLCHELNLVSAVGFHIGHKAAFTGDHLFYFVQGMLTVHA